MASADTRVTTLRVTTLRVTTLRVTNLHGERPGGFACMAVVCEATEPRNPVMLMP
ncbi:hypothetical protein ABZX62_14475 [Streptomyces flavidovirens]|uniref:hypothetical protein n=1 Tax=Streptomyces flavidovirens TaxID=67298 RepID=UPI0033B6F757